MQVGQILAQIQPLVTLHAAERWPHDQPHHLAVKPDKSSHEIHEIVEFRNFASQKEASNNQELDLTTPNKHMFFLTENNKNITGEKGK